MALTAQIEKRRPQDAQWDLTGLLIKLSLIAAVLMLAGCPVAYIMWPRWPDQVSLDAPTLPITIGGLPLNVPPAAIRVPMQRRTGTQERIDLVFLWPSLVPPDPAAKQAPEEMLNITDRVFMIIATSDGTPPPAERLKATYPRYAIGDPALRPDGLMTQGFRTDTPYQGEDLLYEANAPERFLIRCTRAGGFSPGTCLHERRIANADITVRFPRDWLSDWRTVADNIDRLMTTLRPSASR